MYSEVQQKRRAWEDLQAERDEAIQAWKAVEGEVASLRAYSEQENVWLPGVEMQEARAWELQELLRRVQRTQASLVYQRSWLVGSMATAQEETMCEWLIVVSLRFQLTVQEHCLLLDGGALTHALIFKGSTSVARSPSGEVI